MSRLLWRDVRAQAWPALAVLATCLLLVPVIRLGAQLGVTHESDLRLTVWALLLITPWLLGATAFAPDLESGAAGFTRALPLRPGLRFAGRLLVAAGWSAAAIAAGLGGFALLGVHLADAGRLLGPVELLGTGVLALVALGMGCLSAQLIRRTLLAFAGAPAVLAIPALGLKALLDAFGAGPEAGVVGAALLGLGTLAIAAWIELREAPRAELSPGGWGRLAVGCAALLCAQAGLLGGAYALDRQLGRPWGWQEGSSQDRRVVAVSTGIGTRLRWERPELERRRLHVIRPGEEPWTLPAEEAFLSLSPDGAYLLTGSARTPRTTLWDARARRRLDAAPYQARPAPRSEGHLARSAAWWWDGDLVLRPDPSGLVDLWGRVRRPVQFGWPCDLVAGVLLLRDEDGLFEASLRAVPAADGPVRRWAPGARLVDGLLSPGARWVVALGAGPGGAALWRIDRSGALPPRRLAAELPGERWLLRVDQRADELALDFDPRERRVAVRASVATDGGLLAHTTLVFDLADGRLIGRLEDRCERWTGDGEGLHAAGVLWLPATDELRRLAGEELVAPPLLWLGPRRYRTWTEELDLDAGTAVPCPPLPLPVD